MAHYATNREMLIPPLYIAEHISESKYSIMEYYGGGFDVIVTLVLSTIFNDIKETRFKAWWPVDEEIMEHVDKQNPTVHDYLYNAWALKYSSGKDIRRIEWPVLEKIYRDLIVTSWRMYLNVVWNMVQQAYQIAFAETNNPTGIFIVSLKGVALDYDNQLFITSVDINGY